MDPILFFVLMVSLQLLDGWTTYTALKLSPAAREANPVMRKLFKAIAGSTL